MVPCPLSFSQNVDLRVMTMQNGERSKLSYQEGIVIGNLEDKEHLTNPVSRLLVRRFDTTLLDLLRMAKPKSLHEVGCGEGRLTRILASQYPVPIRASDFSTALIENLQQRNTLGNVEYIRKNIHDLHEVEDHADVVVCCEVLEHLENVVDVLGVLQRLNARYYVLSVPREPIWRVLNLLRAKYLLQLGNTPGHLNHWSTTGFRRLLMNHGFRITRIECPLPWTMVLGTFEAGPANP